MNQKTLRGLAAAAILIILAAVLYYFFTGSTPKTGSRRLLPPDQPRRGAGEPNYRQRRPRKPAPLEPAAPRH